MEYSNIYARTEDEEKPGVGSNSLDKLAEQGVPKRGVHDLMYWAEGLIEQLPESHEGRWSWLVCYGLEEAANELRRKDKRDYVWVKKRGRFFDTDHLPNATDESPTY